MFGAIAGDIIGSAYEWNNVKTEAFELFPPSARFTDDTVLTAATAEALVSGAGYAESYRKWGLRFPSAGYGSNFRLWLNDEIQGPYMSWGNGSAMRVSPVAYARETLGGVLAEAEKSAAVTHNHPEGIKGARALAAAVFLARRGKSRGAIREYIESEFSYDLSRGINDIRRGYKYDVSCAGSVPEALTAFLVSASFEDAVRKAVSLGGDSDTLACMAGSVAEAFYGGVPEDILREVRRLLSPEILAVEEAFSAAFPAAK